ALGVIAVAALMGAAERWSGSREIGLAAGLGAALYPQLAFVTAYINGDAMTFAAEALLVAALAAWARRGEGNAGLTAVGGAAGLVVLAKPYAYSALLPTAAWIGWAAARRRIALAALLRSALLGAAIAAPILAWNAWRTGGDPLGLARYGAFIAAPG